jgi:hypothetical protein
MSTLVTQTISNGTISTSSTNVIQGSAKAWVKASWNGSTLTVNASYNMSSVTRTASNSFTFVMTNALTDANYAVVGSCVFSGTYTGAQFVPTINSNAFTSTTFYVLTTNVAGVANDPAGLSVAVFR